jgi:hypothetical protein
MAGFLMLCLVMRNFDVGYFLGMPKSLLVRFALGII